MSRSRRSACINSASTLGALAMVIAGIRVAMIVGKFYSGYWQPDERHDESDSQLNTQKHRRNSAALFWVFILLIPFIALFRR